MELAPKYTPADVEGKWYQYWTDHKLFSSKPDGREPYTVVIPPPNVTGVLHMGHMLNETIQDILVRRARMEGKNACWVPGTDHASIATEAKVVNRLAEQGIKKADLTREEFLKHAWAWTEEHGGIILQQLRRVGASCDWDRTAFTMDEERSKSVIHVFVELYRKGLIYRGVRMVNWDPKALTALSDEEVVYKEEKSKLYYLRYYVADDDMSTPVPEGCVVHTDEEGHRYAVVATTRPETIMGDTAMCINPKDPKNRWLSGKKVRVPLVNRVIPVVEDEYVDVEFGTGCLKVTPAHDINDHALGLKHHLDTIDIFNDNGSISEAAGLYVGEDRFEVRKKIEKDLEAANLMEKVEDYTNNVGFSERTNVPIEPKLSTQWFLKMQHFADLALPPVMSDEIKFYPTKYKNTYRHWLENIKDWCISRQLWWGHRIPAYYLPDNTFVVAETIEEALDLARQQSNNPNLSEADLHQDEDALDTWFSSWLWPISLFQGISQPDNEEFNYYYPTSDLVTGPDIIFFWVARMIMAGYEFTGKMPFKHVYFTGIVRDKLGRKMSKSLGNSPDPLDLIDKFGADGVRMGLMLAAPAGNDILYDDALCEQGRNFCNKIWNCYRLIEGWQVADAEQPKINTQALEWFGAQLRSSAETIKDLFSKYRLSEALMEVYRLLTDEFSGWLLEMVKPAYGAPIDATTLHQVKSYFNDLLHLLHPFMPFITEELWQHLATRKEGESLMIDPQTIPAPQAEDAEILRKISIVKGVVQGVRAIRNARNIAKKEVLPLEVLKANSIPELDGIIMKMANLSVIAVVEEKGEGASSFMVGTSEYDVLLGDLIDKDAEIAKAEAELEHLRGFLASVEKKLSNERFVAHAPAAVVALEQKKKSDSEAKIKALEETLQALRR
ncbi:valyl-tRNA synthetase [Alloprevotella rava F0323]|uniref:Valine--tRNA ligase n=1 Tax=Alloprevotella rava F0323 TaxID=679199 RepID=G5G9M8_9BACT|nr:valine--tRNA ligase [Alloprevotella rava]EHG24078.1 valyl-tRNA synthetase [Alloprevotella rava F0323]